MGFVDEHERATAQNAARQNDDYDAFIDKLDFSTGKYETRVVSPSPVQKPLTGLKHHGDVWRAKLFVKDVIGKYGVGQHQVQVRDDSGVVLISTTVEG